MNAPEPIPLLLRVPPPLLFAATFVAGAGLQYFARQTFPAVRALHFIGFGLVGCAALLALCSVGIFLAARTTIVPFSAASKLVTCGPYRFTRNPMYVSLVLAYVGIATILSQPVALILLSLPVVLIHKIVIPFEEKRMRRVFGEAYDQYCSRVSRWF